MQDRELYRHILGIESPWRVERVELKLEEGEIHVHLEHDRVESWACPECGSPCRLHDHQGERKWRHLDTCQFQTILHARPPRTDCGEHGIRVARLPWAEPGSRFTALFERLAIEWLKAASQKAVAERLGLSWDEIHAVMDRAVKRGLSRRAAEPVRHLGVDEKAFRRGRHYFTLVNDLERSRVLYIAEDRKKASLDGFWGTLTEAQRKGIEAVAMDMWEPYVSSVKEHVEGAARKIVFDKFHIAKHLGEAVDEVRRKEHRTLKAAGDDRLSGAAEERSADVAGVAAEGNGDEAVRLRLRASRAEALPLVARVGGAQPPEADDPGGGDAPAALRERRHLSEAQDHQRRQRVHQLKGPVGQVHRARIPQQGELPDRHLLPLRRARPVTSH